MKALFILLMIGFFIGMLVSIFNLDDGKKVTHNSINGRASYNHGWGMDLYWYCSIAMGIFMLLIAIFT